MLPTVVVVVVVVVAALGSTLSGVAASPRLLGAGVGLGGFAADLNVSTSSLSPPISRSYLASSALTLPGSRWLASRDARGASSCGPNASSCGALALSSRRISRIFVTVCTCACSSISITPSSSSSSSRAGVTFSANRAGEAAGLAVGQWRPATGLGEARTAGVVDRAPVRAVAEMATRVDGGGEDSGGIAGVPGLAASSSASSSSTIEMSRRDVGVSLHSLDLSLYPPGVRPPQAFHGLPPQPSLVLAGGGVLGSSYDGGAEGRYVAVGDLSTLISRTSSSDGLPGDLDTASAEANSSRHTTRRVPPGVTA